MLPTRVTKTSDGWGRDRAYCFSIAGSTLRTSERFKPDAPKLFTRTIGTPPANGLPGWTMPYAIARLGSHKSFSGLVGHSFIADQSVQCRAEPRLTCTGRQKVFPELHA